MEEESSRCRIRVCANPCCTDGILETVIVYGLHIVCGSLVWDFPDISVVKAAVQELADWLIRWHPAPEHLLDVLEDYLARL